MQKFTIPLFYFLLPNKLIFVELYPGARYQRDSSKFYSGASYQRDSSKFYLGASYQRNFNSAAVPCRNHQKRLSPVTGAAFPASVRAPISCQSLRLALTGSNSEALWQQLAQTSSRKPCNVPGHERFSAFFRAGNFAAWNSSL